VSGQEQWVGNQWARRQDGRWTSQVGQVAQRASSECHEQLTGLKVHVHMGCMCAFAFVVCSVPHIIKARNELKCEGSGARTPHARSKEQGGGIPEGAVIFAQQQGIHCLAMSPFFLLLTRVPFCVLKIKQIIRKSLTLFHLPFANRHPPAKPER